MSRYLRVCATCIVESAGTAAFANAPRHAPAILNTRRRQLTRLPLVAAFLFAALATLPACARVQSIDQFGNKKTGWFLASNFEWGDDTATRVVSVKGLGVHKVGGSWTGGWLRSQVVAMPADCQVVVFNDSQSDTHKAVLPANLDDICIQRKVVAQ